MNRKLSDAEIEQTWRALVAQQGEVTGRQLRQALRRQYGSGGSTDRVFDLWRTLTAQRAAERFGEAALYERNRDLERQLAEALALKDAAEQRARLAEARERAHQDHWANQIYDLRQEVERLKKPRLPV